MSVVRINVDFQDSDSISELSTYLWRKFYSMQLGQIVLGTIDNDGISFAKLETKFSDVKEESPVEYIEPFIEFVKNSDHALVCLHDPEDLIRIYIAGREEASENARDAMGYYSDFMHDIPEAIQLLDNHKDFDEGFDAWLKRHGLFLHKSMLAK